jgi:hypothetical protein
MCSGGVRLMNKTAVSNMLAWPAATTRIHTTRSTLPSSIGQLDLTRDLGSESDP